MKRVTVHVDSGVDGVSADADHVPVLHFLYDGGSRRGCVSNRNEGIQRQAFLQRFVAVVLIGLALTWFGVLRSASQQFDKFANLEAVQRSRLDMARTADSGFAKDVDVRTTGGALTIIPMGMVYLMFAPFPWH